jgi:hypothetical protein
MSAPHTYRGRRAATIENDNVRVTVLEEGGHIAEMLDKRSGINPLWTPPWKSIEPSTYSPSRHPEYGTSSEAALLAGLMGHNLCVDIFGGPSDEEAAAGLTPHGEASIVRYELDVDATGRSMAMRALLPLAQLRVDRRLDVRDGTLDIREGVENLSACDRPIGWTQHVTLGPPFLEKGLTEFRVSATRSKVFEQVFGAHDDLAAGRVFDWPHAPRLDGSTTDLRIYTDAPHSNVYTAHLMDPAREGAFFVAFSPAARLAFGYLWKQRDFPWLGIWQENYSRTNAPWNGATLTCGLEFGVSPMPESRRAMVDRGRLFDVPTYRWIPAKSRVEVEYCAVIREADAVPELLETGDLGTKGRGD